VVKCSTFYRLVYFYISDTSRNPSGAYKGAYVLGKASTVRPVTTYIYLCGKVMPSLYRLFSNLFFSVTVPELK